MRSHTCAKNDGKMCKKIVLQLLILALVSGNKMRQYLMICFYKTIIQVYINYIFRFSITFLKATHLAPS